MLTDHKSTARRRHTPGSKQRVRSGVMLMELVAGAVLLVVAIGLVVQVLAGQAAAERSMQRKLFANEILSNLMEEQAVLPWNEVTPQSIALLKLPSEADQLLPGAQLSGTVVPAERTLPEKKLTLELSWQETGGQRSKPIVLIAWLYPAVAQESAP